MNFENVAVSKPNDANIIIGQAHFIKTAEDLYEALVNSSPGIKFGLAFSEASQERLVRVEGNDDDLRRCAAEAALNIGAGHSFVVVLRNAYPINVLKNVKDVPEVCTVFCATANNVEVLVAGSKMGRGIIGVIDGESPVGVESDENVKERREFLRKIGYKQ